MTTKQTWTNADGLTLGGGPRSGETAEGEKAIDKEVGLTTSQVAAVAALTERPGTAKVDNTLKTRIATNTAADTTFTYLQHLDISPAEFAFFAGSYRLRIEALLEGGTIGADQFARVTDATTARNLQFRLGIPGADPTLLTNGTTVMQPGWSSLTARGVMCILEGAGLPESAGTSIDVANFGFGEPTTWAAWANSSFNFLSSGLRIIVACNWTAAAATNQIIKLRSLSLSLMPG